jgi:hypothetical protein
MSVQSLKSCVMPGPKLDGIEKIIAKSSLIIVATLSRCQRLNQVAFEVVLV